MLFLKAAQHESVLGGAKDCEGSRRASTGKVVLLILLLFSIAGGVSARWISPIKADADELLSGLGRGPNHFGELFTFFPSPEVAEYIEFIDEGHDSSIGYLEPDFHMRNTTRAQRVALSGAIDIQNTNRTQRIRPFEDMRNTQNTQRIRPFWDMRNTQNTQRIEPFWDMRNTQNTQRIEPFWDMRNTQNTQRIEPFWDMRNTQNTQRAATRVP